MPRALTRRTHLALLVRWGLPLVSFGCGDGGSGVTVPALEVVTSTTGAEPDLDGYSVVIDGGAGRPIGVTDTLVVDPLAAGEHTVALDEVAPSCQVQGSNTRVATLVEGATTRVRFDIACGPGGTGSLKVTTSTSGPGPDPDGYAVAVDDGPSQAIGNNGTITISSLLLGDHSVLLTGIANNCVVGGSNPQTVAVTGGNTTQAAFTITCTTVVGSIEVTTTTTGADPDPDGYTVLLDGSPKQPVGANATVTVGDVGAGDHTVGLADVAGNCTVSGQNPVQVTVTAGATAQAAFQIACVPIPAIDGQPAWSPKGTKIAFVSDRDDNDEIYVMSADGTDVTRLTNNAAFDDAPAWSPDGAKIAFESDRAGNFEIYVMNAGGTGATRLTDNAAFDGGPAWSPDGSKIAFESNRDGHSEIYVMKANGTDVTRLTNNLPSQCTHPPFCKAEYGPAWSPDGTKIAFIHRAGDFGFTELDVMNADGSGVIRLTSAPLTGRLAWSRTGKIAFDPYRGGSHEIFVVKADGSGLTQLTNNPAYDVSPSWSPDGTKIVFESNRAGNIEIYVMNADGSGVLQLTDNAASDGVPAWAR